MLSRARNFIAIYSVVLTMLVAPLWASVLAFFIAGFVFWYLRL